MGVRMNDDRAVEGGPGAGRDREPEPEGAGAPEEARGAEPGAETEPGAGPGSGARRGAEPEPDTGGEPSPSPSEEQEQERESGPPRRRPPTLTTDTARPEGGGRAAPGDAPAPARQWPLLTVLAIVGAGLLIVGLDPFAEAFRVGTILVGVGLLTGAVMRRVVPSVGMLAVRSRFTDMVTYGVLGVAITLLALVAQPGPWLELPFVEDLVRFTVREPK
ncbi:DUF3017 domain-containing protein [Streptomyces sp. NPDC001985]|uniref:DUF3017 domain-containing protein n=1 Tax=Streptomyces sp. NPDC001985 TaxID=3154406 RepID=UPI0033177AA2